MIVISTFLWTFSKVTAQLYVLPLSMLIGRLKTTFLNFKYCRSIFYSFLVVSGGGPLVCSHNCLMVIFSSKA